MQRLSRPAFNLGRDQLSDYVAEANLHLAAYLSALQAGVGAVPVSPEMGRRETRAHHRMWAHFAARAGAPLAAQNFAATARLPIAQRIKLASKALRGMLARK